jgi:hypothetical protein
MGSYEIFNLVLPSTIYGMNINNKKLNIIYWKNLGNV